MILNASIQLPVAGIMAIFIVVISGVLLGGRGSAYATLTIGLAAITQVTLDRTGVMSPDTDWKQTGYGTSDLAIQTVFAVAIAGIIWHTQRDTRRSLPEVIQAAGARLAHERDRTKDLTPRESEIVRLVAEGLSNKEIGDALFVSDRTVQTHVRNAMAKAGAKNRAELAAVAVREGLTGSAAIADPVLADAETT